MATNVPIKQYPKIFKHFLCLFFLVSFLISSGVASGGISSGLRHIRLSNNMINGMKVKYGIIRTYGLKDSPLDEDDVSPPSASSVEV